MINMNEVDYRKEHFQEGDTVVLLSDMDNDPRPIPAGTKGTVENVDDMGTVFITWENGRYLGAVIEDKIEVVNERPKFKMR